MSNGIMVDLVGLVAEVKKEDPSERRKFPRIEAPLYCRPAKRRLPRRKVVDVGLGGMRVYSDEPFKIGARFDVELFLPDATSINCLTEVMWIKNLDPSGPAKYDLGLKFLDVPPGDLLRLKGILAKSPVDPDAT